MILLGSLGSLAGTLLHPGADARRLLDALGPVPADQLRRVRARRGAAQHPGGVRQRRPAGRPAPPRAWAASCRWASPPSWRRSWARSRTARPIPMAIGMSLCAAAALISALVAIRRRSGGGRSSSLHQRRPVELALHVGVDPAQQEADVVDHHLAVVGLEVGVDRQDLEHPPRRDLRPTRCTGARRAPAAPGAAGPARPRRASSQLVRWAGTGWRTQRRAAGPRPSPAATAGRRRRWWRR